MTTTSCSLPRLHGCCEGNHSTCSFLALLPIHSGRTIQFEIIIYLNPHPISRSLNSNLHEFEFISTSMATQKNLAGVTREEMLKMTKNVKNGQNKAQRYVQLSSK